MPKEKIIEFIKSGKSTSEIIRIFNGELPSEYFSALRELINQDRVEDIVRRLVKNLPEDINISFRDELEKLYHALTTEYIPSSLSIRKIIERIYENGHRYVLFKILRALAERGIKEYEKLQETYPTLKNEINERIEELKNIIKELKKLES